MIGSKPTALPVTCRISCEPRANHIPTTCVTLQRRASSSTLLMRTWYWPKCIGFFSNPLRNWLFSYLVHTIKIKPGRPSLLNHHLIVPFASCYIRRGSKCSTLSALDQLESFHFPQRNQTLQVNSLRFLFFVICIKASCMEEAVRDSTAADALLKCKNKVKISSWLCELEIVDVLKQLFIHVIFIQERIENMWRLFFYYFCTPQKWIYNF